MEKGGRHGPPAAGRAYSLLNGPAPGQSVGYTIRRQTLKSAENKALGHDTLQKRRYYANMYSLVTHLKFELLDLLPLRHYYRVCNAAWGVMPAPHPFFSLSHPAD